MTKEIREFIKNSRTAILRNYADYVENMVEAEQYEEMEDFEEWVWVEYKRNREEYI